MELANAGLVHAREHSKKIQKLDVEIMSFDTVIVRFCSEPVQEGFSLVVVNGVVDGYSSGCYDSSCLPRRQETHPIFMQDVFINLQVASGIVFSL